MRENNLDKTLIFINGISRIATTDVTQIYAIGYVAINNA